MQYLIYTHTGTVQSVVSPQGRCSVKVNGTTETIAVKPSMLWVPDKNSPLYNPIRGSPGCDHCSKATIKLKVCGGCHSVGCSSVECQRSAWKAHKKVCKEIKAELQESNKPTVDRHEVTVLFDKFCAGIGVTFDQITEMALAGANIPVVVMSTVDGVERVTIGLERTELLALSAEITGSKEVLIQIDGRMYQSVVEVTDEDVYGDISVEDRSRYIEVCSEQLKNN